MPAKPVAPGSMEVREFGTPPVGTKAHQVGVCWKGKNMAEKARRSLVLQDIMDAFLDYLNAHPEELHGQTVPKFKPPVDRPVCAVCHFVVSLYEDMANGEVIPGTGQWRHSGQVEGSRIYDHEVVMVRESEADFKVRGVCDFCGVPDMTAWLYFTKELLASRLATANYGGTTRTPIGQRNQRGKFDTNLTKREVTGFNLLDFASASTDHLWAACDPCHVCIKTRDINRLAQRFMRVQPTLTGIYAESAQGLGEALQLPTPVVSYALPTGVKQLIKAHWEAVFWGNIWFYIPAPDSVRGTAA